MLGTLEEVDHIRLEIHYDVAACIGSGHARVHVERASKADVCEEMGIHDGRFTNVDIVRRIRLPRIPVRGIGDDHIG